MTFTGYICFAAAPNASASIQMTTQEVMKRNNVTIVGEGSQVMLLAHGFGCDQHAWHYILNAFTPDYTVVLFDYVGAGKSDLSAYDKARYSTLHGYAQDILEICEALSLHEVIFIGHSVSSMIGVLAAKEKPEYFKKLVFIGPSPRYINDEDYVGGFETEDLEKLFEYHGQQLPGLEPQPGSCHYGQQQPASTGRRTGKQLLRYRSRNCQTVCPCYFFIR